MNKYKCRFVLDIPVGHAILNYGHIRVEDSNANDEGWVFAIGYSDTYHEPDTFCEHPLNGYEYELGIKLRTPEQAEAYSDMFSKMAIRMRESRQEKEEKNESI